MLASSGKADFANPPPIRGWVFRRPASGRARTEGQPRIAAGEWEHGGASGDAGERRTVAGPARLEPLAPLRCRRPRLPQLLVSRPLLPRPARHPAPAHRARRPTRVHPRSGPALCPARSLRAPRGALVDSGQPLWPPGDGATGVPGHLDVRVPRLDVRAGDGEAGGGVDGWAGLADLWEGADSELP